jgi:hypothetical protein
MLIRNKKGQSILEYAILLGVVIAALLIMQAFVKRGYQGGLKDASDRMGDQFSAGGTTEQDMRQMSSDQVIVEEVATGSEINAFGVGATGTLSRGAVGYTERTGGTQTMTSQAWTDSAEQERARVADYSDVSESATNFNDPF